MSEKIEPQQYWEVSRPLSSDQQMILEALATLSEGDSHLKTDLIQTVEAYLKANNQEVPDPAYLDKQLSDLHSTGHLIRLNSSKNYGEYEFRLSGTAKRVVEQLHQSQPQESES